MTTQHTPPAAPALDDDDVRVLRDAAIGAIGLGDGQAVVRATRILRVLDALESLQRAHAAAMRLVAAKGQQCSELRNGAAAALEAVATLESERKANARLTDEIERLQRECDEAHKDAARYRWLRDTQNELHRLDHADETKDVPGQVQNIFVCEDIGLWTALNADELDAAIDAAMQAQQGGAA